MSYLSVMYDEQEKPVTTYPVKLAKYLLDKYGIERYSSLLDAGCGRGDMAVAFYLFDMDVYGIDIISNELHKEISIQQVDFDVDIFPYQDNSFDVIFSKSVIEHLKNPEHYLSECLRVLRPGGQFILLTPDWLTQHTIFYNDPTHCHPYTVEGVSNSMKMAGFASVKAEKFYQVPIVWKHPIVKVVCRLLQLLIPVHWGIKNHFIRFSIEHMVLGTGTKRG